jgi:hypothetical protein
MTKRLRAGTDSARFVEIVRFISCHDCPRSAPRPSASTSRLSAGKGTLGATRAARSDRASGSCRFEDRAEPDPRHAPATLPLHPVELEVGNMNSIRSLKLIPHVLLGLATLAFGAMSASAQQTIVQYGSANTTSLAPTVVDGAVSANNLNAGPGLGLNTGSTFNFNGWDTASTTFDAAAAAGDFWTFGFSITDPNALVDLTTMDIRLDRSGTGPDDFEIRASVNGGASSSLLIGDFAGGSLGVNFLASTSRACPASRSATACCSRSLPGTRLRRPEPSIWRRSRSRAARTGSRSAATSRSCRNRRPPCSSPSASEASLRSVAATRASATDHVPPARASREGVTPPARPLSRKRQVARNRIETIRFRAFLMGERLDLVRRDRDPAIDRREIESRAAPIVVDQRRAAEIRMKQGNIGTPLVGNDGAGPSKFHAAAWGEPSRVEE